MQSQDLGSTHKSLVHQRQASCRGREAIKLFTVLFVTGWYMPTDDTNLKWKEFTMSFYLLVYSYMLSIEYWHHIHMAARFALVKSVAVLFRSVLQLWK